MRRRRIATWAVAPWLLSLVAMAGAQDAPSPADVRRLAQEAGLDSLGSVAVPLPSNLRDYLLPGAAARRAAVQLGKALFWDAQVGSDGQACASCHFHAGADSRTKNQLSPGLRNENSARRATFDPTASGGGGPDYDLTAGDFPFHQLDDPQDRTSSVVHDSDDVASSQGVFAARFTSIVRGRADEKGIAEADPVFDVGGVNVRRVASRNTPSVINAVFNVVNFWDGRAHALFNGVSTFGPLDATATVLLDTGRALVPRTIAIDHGSLASQAVGPPTSDLEMAFRGRPFPALGRKLLALRPLGQQLVHPRDSVLGALARARLGGGQVTGKPGLTIGYADLVKRAFQRQYWSSGQRVGGYSQMENNWSLFFGLAIELYESTLVADDSPFDEFMEGDDTRLTDVQQQGLLTFVNRGPGRSDDPVFADFFQGNCVSCHAGPALTDAAAEPPVVLARSVELTAGTLAVGTDTAWRDAGFSNIGVRPTGEDVGRGGVAGGLPLSFVRQSLLALPFAPPLPSCGGPGDDVCPVANRVAVDGAFKVPGLRNVELTGPYFHDGGQATLRQVVAFYERLGDFSNENVHDLDPRLAGVRFLEESEILLVAFMQALTDERVRDESAPFDHPQLMVPNGHPGDPSGLTCVRGLRACDETVEIPAVGEKGRGASGLPPLEGFLGLDPMS